MLHPIYNLAECETDLEKSFLQFAFVTTNDIHFQSIFSAAIQSSSTSFPDSLTFTFILANVADLHCIVRHRKHAYGHAPSSRKKK